MVGAAVWVAVLVVLVSCRCGVGPSYEELGWTKGTRVHVADRLGSAAVVLDGEGEVVARAAHRPYGERWVDWQRGEAKPPAYRFTDKEEDRLSGAVYIGARHYLPALGRWASVDPLLRDEPDYLTQAPPQANGYLYATANPIMLLDDGGRNPAVAVSLEVLKVLMAREAQARARHAAAVEKLRRQMRPTGGAKADAIGEMAQAVVKRTEGAREVIQGFQEASVMAASQAAGGAAASGAVKLLGAVLGRVAPEIVRALRGTEAAGGLGTTARGSGRVFWSGKGAQRAAEHYAERVGGATPEQTVGGRVLSAVSRVLPWKAVEPLWRGLSRSFAAGAKGQVDAFVSPVARSNSIWRTVEKPMLQNNGKVSNIRIHLPVID